LSNKHSYIKSKAKQFPREPGIYIFKNNQDEIIYIGKALSLHERVKSYFLPSKDPKVRLILQETADLEFILTESGREAAFLENNFIRRYQPKFNFRLKDDKHFPFLKITMKEPYPFICLVRKIEDDGSRYFGPFSPASEARNTITLISKSFGIRTCQEKIPGKRRRPCLEHDLGLCSAPCVDLISKQEYEENLKNALLFLQGHTDEAIKNIKKKMKEVVKNQDFERAAHWRDLIKTLVQIKNKPKLISVGKENTDIFGFSRKDKQVAICVFIMRQGEVIHSERTLLQETSQESAPSILSSYIKGFYKNRVNIPETILLPFAPADLSVLQDRISARAKNKVGILVPQKGKNKKLTAFADTNADILLTKHLNDISPLIEMQKIFQMKSNPLRIEGFDISNTGGEESVGSLVVFENGKPNKKQYRRYRVKEVSGPNDIASLKEVITRRYTRLLEENQDLPDMIMVDGGKGQFSAAGKALKSLGLDHIPVIALAKKEEVVFSAHHPHGIMLERTSPALKLVQHVRDEAHRFAISLHRKRREKKSFVSVLDDVPSIGPKKKSLLLTHYKNVKAIQDAPRGEIEKLVGKKAAKALKNLSSS
jgi:excinuclease ABC subunit C